MEKPREPLSNRAAAGIYVADRRIFDYFPEEQDSPELDLGFDVIPRLVGNMRNYSIDKLIDIGTHENYARAMEIWQRLSASREREKFTRRVSMQRVHAEERLFSSYIKRLTGPAGLTGSAL